METIFVKKVSKAFDESTEFGDERSWGIGVLGGWISWIFGEFGDRKLAFLSRTKSTKSPVGRYNIKKRAIINCRTPVG